MSAGTSHAEGGTPACNNPATARLLYGVITISGVETADTDTATPVLSAILQDSYDMQVPGFIYLETSSGTAIGGSPTATGTLISGERLTYQVPPGVLTAGESYQWYAYAAIGSGVICEVTATSPMQDFTAGSAGTGSQSGPDTVTVSGAALTGETAPIDSAACSGSPCAPTTGGSLDVGSDGTDHWDSALIANLSAIPTGAEIDSATLDLTRGGCLGGACPSDTLNIEAANATVGTAGTGTALAALPETLYNTEAEASGTSQYDISQLVDSWYEGLSPNDGLILTAQDESTAAEGVVYNGPSATTNPAEILVTYTPATVPTAPTSLTLTAGDSGLIATWDEPQNTGYVDTTGQTDGVTSYSVEVLDGTGTVVDTQSTNQTSAVITGLTDGTSYTVQVTATNPVGTGPAASSDAVSPEAVPGGSAQYITAVSQLLNAADQMEEGTYSTASAATASDSYGSEVSTWLGYDASADYGVSTLEAANDETDTADSTTLSNSLAVLSSDGSSVTVYTTATEAFTTVDTRTGTTVDNPGSEVDADAYTFMLGSSSTNTALTNYADATAVLDPVSRASEVTAYSASLDGSLSDGPAPLSVTNSSQYLAVPTSAQSEAELAEIAALPASDTYANRSGAVNWANGQENLSGGGSYNGFGDDCTDFVSRALHFGGGMPENPPWDPPAVHANDDYWFQDHGVFGTSTTYSWADAQHLLYFESNEHAYWLQYALDAGIGDVIFVDWSGSNVYNINHSAILQANEGGNLYVDQHSPTQKHEPVFKEAAHGSWQSADPKLAIWIAVPMVDY